MKHRILGTVLIVVGIVLTIWGYNIYDSATSQIALTENSGTIFEAWVSMIAGVIFILTGITKIN